MELLTDSAKRCTSKGEWMTVRVLEWTSWPSDLYWISFENGSSFTYIFAVWESRLHIKCWLHWSTVLTAMALSIWSSCPVIKLAFVVILTWERARARVCVCILLSLPPPPPPPLSEVLKSTTKSNKHTLINWQEKVLDLQEAPLETREDPAEM